MNLRLRVGVVAWWPGAARSEPGLTVYAPTGDLLEGTSDGDTDIEARVRNLIDGAVPGALKNLLQPERPPERVNFAVTRDGVDLIYTAIVPASVTLLNQDGEPTTEPGATGWVPIDDPQLGNDLDSSMLQVRSHWRHVLQETTAAFDLLPRYFTTPQARSLYSSVWGAEQDAGNFHRWLHQLNAGTCSRARPEEIINARSAVSDGVWKTLRLTKSVDARSLLTRATPGVIGASVLGLGALAGIGPIAVGAAVAGGLTAFQAGRQKGPQPIWYRRADQRRSILKTPYAPRPVWLSSAP